MLTSTTINTRRKQDGITLIEVSIGLIIAAIIAAAAFIAFQNNNRRSEVRENISNITEVSSEIKNKFIRTDSFGPLTVENAFNAGVFAPLSVAGVGANAVATNSYGGVVGLVPADRDMTWAGVPEDQCLDVVLGVESGFPNISIDGTAVKTNGALAAIATVEANCAGTNTLLLSFN